MYAHNTQIANLKASADIIVETGPGETYLGFCSRGTTATSQARWSVLQILETDPGNAGNVITFKWAAGQCNYDQVFDDYATLTYAFKNF